MDVETKKRQEELIGDSEESTVSSCSSSEIDDDSYYIMQPPSLNQPFDEISSTISENVESKSVDVHHSFSHQVINLEQRCLESQRPLHFIIKHYYLLQENCQQLSDAETVFTRLLGQETCNLWKHERINLHNLFPDNDLIIPGIRLRSADVEALTPFQLAIVLNLPILVRVWLSQEDTKVVCLEDELGRTPLMLACELHRIECIKTLLSLIVKPKLDYRESEGGNSAYSFCCLGKRILTKDVELDNTSGALEILIKNTPFSQQKRALISVNKERQSLLHMACYSGV
eukprot:scaffold297738_cov89-Cyclotella_meneghiniana.AAC.1